MSYYRIKPVTKKIRGKKKSYYYVYEVESYRRKRGKGNKVKQKTLKFLGPYLKFKKKFNEYYSVQKAMTIDSKDGLIKEIVALNLRNCGFKKNKEIFVNKNVCVDLNKIRVYDKNTGKDVYLNINDGFFGTETFRKLVDCKLKDRTDLVEFVKNVKYVGITTDEELLKVIISKMPLEEFKESYKTEANINEFQQKHGW